jgi:hypothetical protein
MANVKISALPSTTATTLNDWVIKNDSGETTTSKVQIKNACGLTSINGNSSIQSASYLTALGTTASTQSAIAIGNGAEATSPYSIAIGHQALNTNRDGNRDYYIAIGYQARSITEGVALGKDAQCLATGGFAVGNGTQVYGNGGFALGNDAKSYSLGGIAIGGSSRDNGGLSGKNYGVAIGVSATTTQEQSVALGYQVQDIYSATTHVNNFHAAKTISQNIVTGGTITTASIDVDLSQGDIATFTLSAATAVNFTNFRNGQRVVFWVYSTGSHNITAITIAGGGTVYTKNGSLPSPTNTGYTLYQGWIIDGNLILLEETAMDAV